MIKSTTKRPYSIVLTISIVAIVLLSVGLISFISFLNEKNAIENLSGQIQNQVNSRVELQIDDYLQVPQTINGTNLNFMKLNHFTFNSNDLNKYFLSEFNQYSDTKPITNGSNLNLNSNVMAITYGDEQGNYIGAQMSVDSKGNYYRTEVVSNVQTNNKLTYYKLDSVGNVLGLDSQTDSKYDPRVRPWYISAKNAKKPT